MDWKVATEARPYCAVCQMERNMQHKAECEMFSPRNRYLLAYCEKCKVYGHINVKNDSKLQNIPELENKSCFEILHADCCKGLFDNSKNGRRSVSTKHYIYNNLLKQYDIPKKKGSRSGIRKGF